MEFHDTGTQRLASNLWLADCECGWEGEPTPLVSHALEQAAQHRQAEGYEG
jgi:hypothetical protein